MSERKSLLIHLPEEVKRKLKIEAVHKDQPLKVFIEDILIERVAGKRIKAPVTVNPVEDQIVPKIKTGPGGSY